ncbi:ATP-binding protein, partial [Candidatus Peregrinibacteria bacterium]|nr:ATP-binding protein [Candidatus Peregrinibacteria bacterium]
REKIFERFYRASNAKKMRPDGTGLGLYIAAMLAKRIGAAITFTSEEGRGSSFRVRVPLRAG